MTKKYLKKVQILSAALLSSTFVLAEPKIIQSTGTVVNADPVKVVKVPAANEQALAELLFQFQQIQTEVADLRGRVEELQFELDQLRAESKDRYIDLDRRLSGQPLINESGSLGRTDELDAVSAAENDPVAIEQKTASVDDIDPQIIEAEYNEAKDLIRQKDYVGSIKAFSDFVTKYPNSSYTANAWYWMGEVYLVIPDLDRALASFKVVVDEHSSHHKHPDALYRLGVTLVNKTDRLDDGKKYLEQLISDYPDSQLSQRAQRTLDSL